MGFFEKLTFNEWLAKQCRYQPGIVLGDNPSQTWFYWKVYQQSMWYMSPDKLSDYVQPWKYEFKSD